MRFLKICFGLTCVVLWSRQSFAGDTQWVEIRSPNFSLITDAGDQRGRDVAFHFEQMRSAFGNLMTKAEVNLPVPLQIVAFRSTSEITQVAPLFNGKPVEIAGRFQGGDDRTFIMLDVSVDNPWTVVFHEYAHQLAIFRGVPIPGSGKALPSISRVSKSTTKKPAWARCPRIPAGS